MAVRDLERLRPLALALPETHEELTWGDHPTFRVRRKIFVIVAADADAITLKADPEEKRALLDTGDPRYYRPAYVDTKGWLGVTLGRGTDWDEIRELVTTSYCLIAPKTLVKKLELDIDG
jgi:predicted DNA-binding protein (MmcQ/YjbR family)